MLIAVDIVLVVLAIKFGDLWLERLPGEKGEDPFNLLTRTGGVWMSFVIVQVIAVARFTVEPVWLLVVAGTRSTELVADWFYLTSASPKSWFDRTLLLSVPLINAFLTVIFLASFSQF